MIHKYFLPICAFLACAPSCAARPGLSPQQIAVLFCVLTTPNTSSSHVSSPLTHTLYYSPTPSTTPRKSPHLTRTKQAHSRDSFTRHKGGKRK